MIAINEIGKQYGNLTVTGRGPTDGRGEVKWVCSCGCGKQVDVLGSNLRNGRSRSCGCKKRLPRGEAALNFLFRNLKKSARERGHEWHLTKDQLAEFSCKPCHYCGIEPYQQIKDGYNGFNGGIKYNGLDRVDSAKDYTIDNVVPCCGTCNYAKRTMSEADFKDWAIRLYHHWASM